MNLRRMIAPLAVAAGSVALSWHWWANSFLTTHDLLLHLPRIYELDRAIGQGIVYPRWAPDLYYGYGYPVFNFYPPLAYYLVESLHLVGLDLLGAIKLVFTLCFLVAGLGAFVLARDFYREMAGDERGAELGGLVAGLAYASSPYFLADAYIRGAIAETLAMALLPFFFWSLRRVILVPAWSSVGVAALLGALLVVSHNLTVFFGAPFIVGYALINLGSIRPRRELVMAAGRLALAGLLALLLAAFYWLPAYFELPLVAIGQPGWAFVLQSTLLRSLLPSEGLIQVSWFYQSFGRVRWPLSLAELALGAAGLVVSLRAAPRRLKAELAYFALVVVFVAFAVSEWARPIWLALPSLWVIQFPWRLEAFWTLAIVLLGGLLALAVGRWFSRRPVLPFAACVALAVAYIGIGVINLYPLPWNIPSPANLGLGWIAQQERRTHLAGASAFAAEVGEYLPSTVRQPPVPKIYLTVPSENAGGTIPEVKLEAAGPNEWRLDVNSAVPFALPLRSFYYPDWYAQIDGQVTPAFPSTENGILTVNVPAGEHQVTLEQGSTVWSLCGWMASGFGLLVFGLVVIQSLRRRELMGIVLALVAGLLGLIAGLPLNRAAAAHLPALHAIQLDINENLRLIGYRVEPDGREVLVHLYWQIKSPISREMPVSARMVNGSGEVVSQHQDYPRFETAYIANWKANEIGEDLVSLAAPEGTGRSSYGLELAWGENGRFQRVGEIIVDSVPPVSIAHPLDALFDGSIRLLGYDSPDLSSVRPGSSLNLTLFWRGERDVQDDLTISVQLRDSSGALVAQRDDLPNAGFSLTSIWPPGETIADHRVLELPASLALHPGMYHLVVGLYRSPGVNLLPISTQAGPLDDDFIEMAAIKVHPGSAPAPEQRLDLRLGSAIRLQGATLAVNNAPGASVTRGGSAEPARITTAAAGNLDLALAWLAEQAVGTDYTVFVHVLDASGQLAAQQDRPPVGGQYGTNLWEAGEKVPDRYSLPLSGLAPGEYRVVVGMYRADTGERLAVLNGDGGELPNREVVVATLQITEPAAAK